MNQISVLTYLIRQRKHQYHNQAVNSFLRINVNRVYTLKSNKHGILEEESALC